MIYFTDDQFSRILKSLNITEILNWEKLTFSQILKVVVLANIIRIILKMYDDYNTIENHQWIPKEAFLYFPTGDSTKKQEDDFKIIFRN